MRAIPRGSLASIFISSSVYISIAVLVGSTFIDKEPSTKLSSILSCDAPSKLYVSLLSSNLFKNIYNIFW